MIMMRLRRPLFSGLLAAGLLSSGALPLLAMAQSFPPQADPGRVLQWNMRQWDLQRNSPWLFRPVEDKDYRAPDIDSLIEFHNMDVQGQILRQDPVVPAGDRLPPLTP